MQGEFAEWLVDACFGVNAQMGLDDTILDMVLGVLGGCHGCGTDSPTTLARSPWRTEYYDCTHERVRIMKRHRLRAPQSVARN
jgi:hypothetical protein